MSDDNEDLVRLRKAIGNLTEVLEADTKARREQTALIEAQTKQLATFNQTLGDAMAVVEQMMPMLEGAAQGSSMLGTAYNLLKGAFAQRRARAGARGGAGPRL